MVPRSGRSSPDPRFSSVVELGGGYLHGSLNLQEGWRCLFRRDALAGQSFATASEIERAMPLWDEDVLETWMAHQPGARLQARVIAQIVGNNEEQSTRI